MDGSYIRHCLIKCAKIAKNFDYQISRNLKDGGIEPRPTQTNGLWCCFLLPTILIVYHILYNVPQLYSLLAYISIGLLCYCILFIIFISVSCLVLREPIYGGCISSSIVSALFVYTFLENDLLFSLVTTIPSVYLFSTLLRVSLTMFPKTFTIGEAMIVSQGLVLFLVLGVTRGLCNMHDKNTDLDLIGGIVFTILSTVGLIVTALYLMIKEERTLQNIRYIFAVGIVYTLTVLHFTLELNCIIKILYFIFTDSIRVHLFIFWLSLVAVAIVVVYFRTQLAVKASTVTRKTFHVLASLVFMSGIIYDVNFMILASGGGLALIILVEGLRKSGIQPISSQLQAAFNVYSDEKDVGSFAMTPMYLFVALACPLLLVPDGGSQVELLSGVLAIGVGDTAASWFGSKYGFNKWAECDKTLEGTAFNIMSQVATVYALQMFEVLHSPNGFIRTVFAATVSGLVEAKTDQVDNLILPLVTILAYQLTTFMS